MPYGPWHTPVAAAAAAQAEAPAVIAGAPPPAAAAATAASSGGGRMHQLGPKMCCAACICRRWCTHVCHVLPRRALSKLTRSLPAVVSLALFCVISRTRSLWRCCCQNIAPTLWNTSGQLASSSSSSLPGACLVNVY